MTDIFAEITACDPVMERDGDAATQAAAAEFVAFGECMVQVKPDGSTRHVPRSEFAAFREPVTTTPARARTILAIDPGTTESGWVVYDGQRVLECGVSPNREMLDLIDASGFDTLAIEMIASYGMAVGREVFETCVWIGRMVEAFRDPEAVKLVYRRDVKLHLCGSSKAKDPNIRQALLDMFPRTGGGKTPQVGTKSQPGPLYGVSSHAWPALGVAVTALNQRVVVQEAA